MGVIFMIFWSSFLLLCFGVYRSNNTIIIKYRTGGHGFFGSLSESRQLFFAFCGKKLLVRSTTAPAGSTPAASETSGTSGHFAATSVSVTGPAAPPAAAVSTTIAAPWSRRSISVTSPSSVSPVSTAAIAAHPAATTSTHASAHTTAHHHATVGFDSNFLDLHFLSIDNDGTLFEQSVCRFLLVEGDEAKVLGFAVLAAVNWPLDLHNLTVLAEMLTNDILRDGGVFELANVNFAS